jgi:uncharacterized RDD family membrane protein YckC
MHPDEQVVTGEAVALDLRLAGVGSRGVAAIIDIAIATLAELLVISALGLVGYGANSDAQTAILLVAIVGIILGYPVAFETLWRGRTLGKAIMGLRVVRDDGGPIRFRHAFVRGLTGVVIEKPGFSLGLLAFIPMLAGRRKKRIGDLLAGTVVLQERVPGNLDAPIAMPPPLAWWAASLDLSAVDDALALRLRQFLARANQFTPEARASLEHQLTSEVVLKVGPPPAHTPGWALIAAVLAERRRRAFDAMRPLPGQPPPGQPPPGQPPPGQQAAAQPAWAPPPVAAPPVAAPVDMPPVEMPPVETPPAAGPTAPSTNPFAPPG